jgi:hypothetical protein
MRQQKKTIIEMSELVAGLGLILIGLLLFAPPPLDAAANLTQVHYRWRNDNGWESSSNPSITAAETVTGSGSNKSSFTLGSWTRTNQLVLVAVAIRRNQHCDGLGQWADVCGNCQPGQPQRNVRRSSLSSHGGIPPTGQITVTSALKIIRGNGHTLLQGLTPAAATGPVP